MIVGGLHAFQPFLVPLLPVEHGCSPAALELPDEAGQSRRRVAYSAVLKGICLRGL